MITTPKFHILFKNGVRKTNEAAILWFLAGRGVNGARTMEIVEHFGWPYATVSSVLKRMRENRLVTGAADVSVDGHRECHQFISRLGYSLMTGESQNMAETFQPIATDT